MKHLSEGALRALRAYRSEHAMPPDVRARLLARLPRAKGAEIARVRGRGAHLRLLRWAVPLTVLVVGLGLSLRSPTPAPLLRAAPAQSARSEVPSGPSVEARELEPSTLATVPRSARSGNTAALSRPSANAAAAPRRRPIKERAPTSRAQALPEPSPSAASSAREIPASEVAPPEERAPRRAANAAPGARPAPTSGGSSPSYERVTAEPALRPALSLDDEVMQMRRASDLLRAGDPMRALSALAEHARLFPDGKLMIMRQAARVQALCDLGRQREARQEAARFLADHGDSTYAAQVRHACRGEKDDR